MSTLTFDFTGRTANVTGTARVIAIIEGENEFGPISSGSWGPIS